MPTVGKFLAALPSTPAAAEPLLTPPPIQRQDSARWYADHRPPPVKRQVPLGEEFEAVAAARENMRSRMVRGAHVELNYVFAPSDEISKITRGTRGRISKRMASGWLMVRFEGFDKCVKVRTSNCMLALYTVAPKPVAPDAGYNTFYQAMLGVVAPERKELWAKMSTDERRVWERAEQQVQAISDRGV
jgi:hypothetical protein